MSTGHVKDGSIQQGTVNDVCAQHWHDSIWILVTASDTVDCGHCLS